MPVVILPIEYRRFKAADGFVPKRVVDPDVHHVNVGGDEEDYIDYEDPSLIFTDEIHQDSARMAMNTLRRERESCDVVLFVAEREILAHRSVLVSFSSTLFDLIHNAQGRQDRERESEENIMGKRNERRPLYLEFPSSDFESFDALVNYAYTSKLEISQKKVADVYKTACFLRVESAAKAAAQFLASNLSPSNAIGVRKCANKTSDVLLAAKVDAYIQNHFPSIISGSPEFTALPCVQVEVIGDWGETEEGPEELATRVLAWFQSQPHHEHRDFRMENLTKASHMLYLDSASVLRDCCDIEDSVSVSSCDIVLDYRAKKKNEGRESLLPPQPPIASLLINPAGPIPQPRRNHHSENGHSLNGRPPSPGSYELAPTQGSVSLNLANLRSGPHMGSSESVNSLASSVMSADADEVQWNIIAVEKYSDSFVIGLAVMHQRLVALSIQIINSAKRELKNGRSETGSPDGSPTRLNASPEATPVDQISINFPLPTLARQRCSHGLVSTGGRLFTYGGYDRGECLSTMEELVTDEETGLWVQWRPMPAMSEDRGRFDAVTADNRCYAIGGSNGIRDLDTVEIFDPLTETWTPGPRMLFAKSNHGCAGLEGVIYCIGGWNGQRGIKEVEILDTTSGEWSIGSPLEIGRYQAGCCSWAEGRAVIAAGGCEAWGCLASVELLNVNTGVWSSLPPLTVARRGCGACVIGSKLYVCGGTDGTKSLASVEVLDLSAPGKGWSCGPALQCARANVRAVFHGGCLMVVGGFSGKTFLPTMEYLELEAEEWRHNLTRSKSQTPC